MSWITIYLIVYGIIALGHIAVQMLLGHLEHMRQRRATYRGDEPTVSVVVPAYNEDPALLHRCLLSIDRQNYPRVEAIVVDDGSLNLDDVLPVHDEFSSGRFRVVRRAENTGKRNCQAVGFEEARTDIVITIDSDTVLEPNAIRTIVRRFEDARVGAVTGNVEVINKRQNLLTRLIAYRYWTAFNQERAAQSRFGVVMCASGPFSAYRRTILDEVREAYVNQTFLGQPCTFGDDRHLTNLVLALGHRVVYDEAAVARTLVPATLRGYLRQQTRWNKSFYREILWTARFAHRRNAYLGADLGLQTLMPFALVGALGLTVYQATDNTAMALRYVGIVAAIGFVRALYGLLRTRSPGFVLFTLYGFMHVLLLIPVRFYALATMRNLKWGTRAADEGDADARRKVVHARSPEGQTEAQHAWSADLRTVIERGDGFLLYWQPVRRLGSDELTHAEILLRLRHDDHVLPPAGFLSIAARNGLMPSVDRRVVKDAVALLASASDETPLRLEVNISAETMRDPYFPALLDSYLGDANAPRRNLVLSIPEAAVAAEPDAAADFARCVRALGCMVAIDQIHGDRDVADTLRLIDALSVDYLKVGGDLVRRLAHDEAARAHVETIAAHARVRGIETVAVYVGDSETLDVLDELRVDYGQGFFIGSPAPVSMALEEIADAARRQQATLDV
jgi:hyaluronan synthase/N-acetylglucosaminyltransferase